MSRARTETAWSPATLKGVIADRSTAATGTVRQTGSMYRVLDLFSGIGGFSLGLERAGPFRTVAFCETDGYCRAVLRKHWPTVPIHDDVRTIDTDGVGRVDLVVGGFPCQPWSVAGQKRGAEDDRNLWPAMVALIEDLRPQWAIIENVRGFVNQPMGLQRSLSDLEGIGYEAVTFIIPACSVDAPHRRDRVWICARNVADTDSERPQGVRPDSYTEGRQEPSERPTGLCNGTASAGRWLPEPRFCRVAHGIRNRVHRLRSLGNAVVPQIVTQIGKAILKADGPDN